MKNGLTKVTASLGSEVWSLIAAAFIVALGFGLIAPVLPQFAKSFGLGITAATVVVSSFAFCRLITAPVGGRLVDRLGERRVYVTGLLIVAVSTAAVSAAQSYWQLLIFRGMGGFGSALFTISAMSLVMRLAPPNARARASSLYATAFLIGNIAGPVIGGLMAGLGMRVPFIVYAVVLLLAASVVHIRLRSLSLHTTEIANVANEIPADRESERDNTDTPRKFSVAWRLPAFRCLLGSGLVNGWSSMGFRVAIYPLFAVAVLGAQAASAGTALTIFAVGNVIGVTIVGRFSDTWGRKPFIVSGLVTTGVATIVIGLSTQVIIFWVLSAVAGFGAGLLNPAQQAVIGDILNGKKAGIVLSSFQMAVDTGVILGPIICGWIADTFGYTYAFIATGTLALLVAALWSFTQDTLRPRHGTI